MKRIGFLGLLICLMVIISGCGGDSKVRVGITGSDTAIWDFIADKAQEEGIDVEVVTFSDYVQPNMALAEGDLDMNAFQTVSYFDSFIDEHDMDLVPIATTVIAPMGLYSEKYDSPESLPDGATIALPKEATNMGRGLLLLEEADLIELEEDFDGNGALDKIVENPKDLQFETLEAAQTPRVLPDVGASIINNGIAVDAGFSPLNDAIFHESETATPYINIIATREEDKNNEVLQQLADIYQSDDVKEVIEEEYDGNQIPTFVPLDKIGW